MGLRSPSSRRRRPARTSPPRPREAETVRRVMRAETRRGPCERSSWIFFLPYWTRIISRTAAARQAGAPLTPALPRREREKTPWQTCPVKLAAPALLLGLALAAAGDEPPGVRKA